MKRVSGMVALIVGAVPAMAAPFHPAASHSVFATPPADPRAVTVRGAGDGRADDGPAIQRALDAASAGGGPGHAGGIVFLPSGTYRITRTLFLWPGVRLFGVGATRPVIRLADHAAGFQHGVANMLIFAGARRDEPGRAGAAGPRVPFPPAGSVPFDPTIADANPGTFYSGISNVDFAIGHGNAAAAAIRFHAAQHAFIAHADFDIGSGLAGLYQVANQAEDLHFHGGRYGILTEKPSPAWQFTLIDSSFDGQREAGIREHEAQLTLVNTSFQDMPVGIDIDRGYGDWLWGRDVRFDRVRRAGVVISNEKSVYTQIGFENAVASRTPVFARFRDSGRQIAGPGGTFRVAAFNHGIAVPALGQMGTTATTMRAEPLGALPVAPARAIRPLPPVAEWADVRSLGAKGDDATDDTAAIQRAIDTHRTVYFPTGRYRVSDTIRLRADTVLVALHPALTQIVLPDGTPAFGGVGEARPLIRSASGGDAIVSGLGLATGGINPRATALMWMAGAGSLVDDVKIQGGHGTYLAGGILADPYNASHTGDPDPARRWDAQYPSIWVTHGGGGTFSKLWSPSTYAQMGFYVSDTQTPGHVYELSTEHHSRVEIGLNRVANWEFLAPQTEEEAAESPDATSFEIRDSRRVLIANYHAYRVARTVKPAPAAVTLYGDNEVRFRNVHVNAESGFGYCDRATCDTFLRASRYPYENAIVDRTHGLEMREREFATLDVAAGATARPATSSVPVEKLADGFYSLSGGAVDAGGGLYFVDHRMQRIYRWDQARGLSLVREQPLDAVNLAVDRSGDVIVLSSAGAEGTVYSFRPDAPGDAISVIPATPTADHPGAATVLPGNLWVNGEFRDQLDPRTYRFTTLAEMFARDMALAKPREYVSPDGSLVLPAYRTVRQGPATFQGWRFSDPLDAYGFVTARPGTRVYVSNESEARTYSGLVGAGGAVTDLKPFADRGGESVATDAQGRVYVANGQIFAYAADGSPTGRIDVPERPLQLIFGGPDGRTLFILCHHALYAARP
jgi:hypothetical protein